MYANLIPLAGTPPMGNLGQVNPNPNLTPPGIVAQAVDPWWGGGEMVWGRANGAIRAMGLCVLLPVFTTNAFRYDATEVPNTANLGRTLCVAQQAMVAGDFGWFQISGITPVDCQAAVAVDTSWGIAAAGQGGANSAGKQVLNSRIVQASTATVVKTGCVVKGPAVGALQIVVPNSDGWFPGVFLSGTGIAALTRVTSIDSSGRIVTISVATTAQVGSVTATYNNATIFYNVAHLNRAFAQGRID